MKNKKKEHIHHFVEEFAFEGSSDEKVRTPKSQTFFTIEGQLGMLKKQISEMNHLFKLTTRWITTFSLPIAILILLYPKKIMLIFTTI